MSKCPKCETKLVQLTAMVNDEKKEILIHPPNAFKKCEYEDDGVEVTVEVVDSYLMEAFQKLVAEGNNKKKWYKWWQKKN